MFAAQCYQAMVEGVLQQLQDEEDYTKEIKEIITQNTTIELNTIKLVMSYVDPKDVDNLPKDTKLK